MLVIPYHNQPGFFSSCILPLRGREFIDVLVRWMNIPVFMLKERQEPWRILAMNDLKEWLLRNVGDTRTRQGSCNTGAFEGAGTRAAGTDRLWFHLSTRFTVCTENFPAVRSCPDDMHGFTHCWGGITSLSKAVAAVLISCTVIDLDNRD